MFHPNLFYTFIRLPLFHALNIAGRLVWFGLVLLIKCLDILDRIPKNKIERRIHKVNGQDLHFDFNYFTSAVTYSFFFVSTNAMNECEKELVYKVNNNGKLFQCHRSNKYISSNQKKIDIYCLMFTTIRLSLCQLTRLTKYVYA